MILKKEGQTGIEYLIILGFVTFAIISILLLAYFYSSMIQDSLVINQVETFARKIVASAESVFYSGEPSKATVSANLPSGVKSIEIIENSLVFTIETSSGISKTAFKSNVPISGNISPTPGLKKIQLIAQENNVLISS